MNPIVFLAVSGALALAALLLAVVRLRETMRIRSATKDLESLDQAFSVRLTSIEGLVGQLNENASAPSHGQRDEKSSAPSHASGRCVYCGVDSSAPWGLVKSSGHYRSRWGLVGSQDPHQGQGGYVASKGPRGVWLAHRHPYSDAMSRRTYNYYLRAWARSAGNYTARKGTAEAEWHREEEALVSGR